MKTREDYRRYEAAARILAEAAETPEERKYFLGRADQHRARADAEDPEGLEELQGRAEELLAEFAESLGEARMRHHVQTRRSGMTETNTRIRWDEDPGGPCYAGRAEKVDACTRSDLFIIWPPDERDSQWLLTSQLPGQDVAIYGDGLEELKGRAEELLAEFAASLGEAMQEPKPFSAQFDRLYGEYLGAGTPVSWEQWLARYEAASRTLAEATETAADCGGEHHVPAE